MKRKNAKNNKVKTTIEEITTIKPNVEIDIVSTAPDITLSNREQLKQHTFVKDGQIVHLKESNESFKFSTRFNLWLRLEEK